MRNSKNGGFRRLRFALLSGVAALGVSGVFAGSANAILAPTDFESGALDLGPAIKGTDILPGEGPPPDVLTVTPDVPLPVLGGAEGVITIAAGDAGFDFPVWTTSAVGQNITVDLVLNEPATGTYNGTTGVLSTDPAEFDAIVTTQAIGPPLGPVNTCHITTDMAFKTDNTGAAPGSMMGQAFSPAVPIGTGAIVTLWPDLPVPVADPGSDCTLVNGLIHGVGGVWFGKGLTTPSRVPEPPAPPAGGGGDTPAPPKKCKKGQKLKKGKCVKKKKKKKKKK